MKKAAIILGCLSLIAAVVFFFSSPTTVTARGRLSGGVRWELNSRGVLTVSGSGEMTDENLEYMETPWDEHKELIKKLVINDGVKSISEYAFFECSHLIYAEIADSVTTVGHHAFAGCSSLTAITLSRGLRELPESVFQDCASLKKVVVPYSVSYIAPQAFEFCGELTEIVLPYELTKIDRRAFANCHLLRSVQIPYNVAEIGEEAFASCTSLADVQLPDKLSSVGADAFYDTAFYNDPLNYRGGLLCSGHTLLVADKAFSGDLIIGEEIACIANEAFSECAGITSVTFPEGLKTIGEGAFRRCSGIKSVRLPDGIVKIGQEAFYGCENLKKISLPDGIRDIGFKAFDHTGFKYDEKNWKNNVLYLGHYVLGTAIDFDGDLVIKKGARSIVSGAFMNCSKLKSITLPDSVTYIGENAFYGCKKMKNIRLSHGITELTPRVLAYCTRLKEVTVPDGVTTVGENAFEGCEGLLNVLLPETVSVFGNSAFYGCPALIHFTFPMHTTKIGDDVFLYCTALKDVCFPGSVSEWNAIARSAKNEELGSAKIHCESHVHPLSLVEKKLATLTAAGRKAYFKCEKCGTTYKDAEGREKIGTSALTTVKIAVVTLSFDTVTYNARYKKPTVTVKDANGKTLKADRDYTVKYHDHKNVGTATATVTFTGNYEGEKTLTFRIVPASVQSVQAKRKDNSATLTWKKSKGAKLYGIFTHDEETGEYTRIAVTEDTEYTVKGLKKDAKYTYYIRAGKKTDGKYYYSIKYTKVNF